MERSNFVPDFSTIPVPLKPERKLKRKRNDPLGGKRSAVIIVDFISLLITITKYNNFAVKQPSPKRSKRLRTIQEKNQQN